MLTPLTPVIIINASQGLNCPFINREGKFTGNLRLGGVDLVGPNTEHLFVPYIFRRNALVTLEMRLIIPVAAEISFLLAHCIAVDLIFG
jgi:hypothetical protein